MTNKKDFFSDLEKALPSSSYVERFKEELNNHLEDDTEKIMQNGFDSTRAQEQALCNIGDSNQLTRAYIKWLRPDLLLSFHFESLIVGSVAAVLCLGYFFLSITSFFREQAGDPNSWEAWVFYIVIPFLFFLIFYLFSIAFALKKSMAPLRLRLISIIAALPFIVILSIVLIAEQTERGGIYFPLFRHAIAALSVNYTALGFAVYILIRGLKTAPTQLAKIRKYAAFPTIITLELYLISSSMIPHLYPQMYWQFLSVREQIDTYTKTALGAGIHLTDNVMYEVWIFGILFAIVAVFCLINLVLYTYSKKNHPGIKFPGFKLVLVSYIILLFTIPPAQNFNLPTNWLRPTTNAIKIIEKKQTGPFYYWFLNVFKDKSGYGVSDINIVNNNFIIHREGPDYINILTNIESVNNFNIRTETLNEGDIIKLGQNITIPHGVLSQGFTCTPPSSTIPSTFANSEVVFCTGLTYNKIPIFSGNTPYAILSILVDNQKKWALINLTEITEAGWGGRPGIYLVSLP